MDVPTGGDEVMLTTQLGSFAMAYFRCDVWNYFDFFSSFKEYSFMGIEPRTIMWAVAWVGMAFMFKLVYFV